MTSVGLGRWFPPLTEDMPDTWLKDRRVVIPAGAGAAVLGALVVLAPYFGVSPSTATSVNLGWGVTIKLVYVEPGRVVIPSGVRWFPDDEVAVDRGFYIGRYEVTQAQYQRIMGVNPSELRGSNRPVHQVAWRDAIEFCRRLSQRTGRSFRLPTRTEWEYACRAGSTGRYCFGDSPDELGQYAWYSANAGGGTHSVGRKRPNGWGLYDMHGNIAEWCADWTDGSRSGRGPGADSQTPGTEARCAVRGGAWEHSADRCGAGASGWGTPECSYRDVGFRVLADADQRR